MFRNPTISQMFVIWKDRSSMTLNSSLELLKDFISVYNVFPQFWKFVFTFERKFVENTHAEALGPWME